MATVTPFEDEFCQEKRTIYSINNCEPTNKTKFGGSVTTSEMCPHCRTHNIFRLYEPKLEYETDKFFVSVYDCECPNCNKEFDIKDEFEKE